MALTLANFKQQIDPTILQRGRQYFRSGHVMALDEVEDGSWSAQVEGTEIYEVEIEQDEAGALTYDCTCPYDLGPICKHVAAVLYAIEEAFPEYLEAKSARPRKRRETRAEKLRKLLEQRTQEELVDLLIELATNDRHFAQTLLVRFSELGADKKAYVSLVKNALNAGKGREGYIDYWGAERSARGVREILSRAEALIERGKADEALPIVQAVIETVIPAVEQADDSNGYLGDVVASAFAMLEDAASQLQGADRRALFEYLLQEAANPVYSGWDLGWDMAGTAAGMISSEQERAEVFAMLDRMSKRREGARYGGFFDRIEQVDEEHAARIKLSIIEQQDGPEAALRFIEQHTHLYGFRGLLAQHYLEARRFEELKQRINGWLHDRSAQWPGIHYGYHRLLLDIAQRQKDSAEVIRLAQQLLADTRDFQYYQLLKETIPSEEWPDFVAKLLRDVGMKPAGKAIAAQICAEEGMWDRVLTLTREGGMQLLERYHQQLEERFPDEVCDRYEQAVFEMLEHASGRPTYQAAAMYLERMKRLGKSEKVKENVALLISTYGNRRAMIDELKKV